MELTILTDEQLQQEIQKVIDEVNEKGNTKKRIADILATLKSKIGIPYTKTETDFLIQRLEAKLASGYQGDLSKTDAAPLIKGFWGLTDTGVHTNLGNINALAGNLNFASFDGTSWSLIAISLPIQEIRQTGGFVYGVRSITFDTATGKISSPDLQTYISPSGINYYVVSTTGDTAIRITDFQAVPTTANTFEAYVIYFDITEPKTSNKVTLKSEKVNTLTPLITGQKRIVVGYAQKTSSLVYECYLPLFNIYKETSNRISPQQAVAEYIKNPVVRQTGGFVYGVRSITFDTATGKISSPDLQTYVASNGLTYFLCDTAGDTAIRITDFQAIPTNASAGVYYVVYFDATNPKTSNKVTLKSEPVNNLTALATGYDRYIVGIGQKKSSVVYEFYSPLLDVYSEFDTSKTKVQKAIEFVENYSSTSKPLEGKNIVWFGDSIIENIQGTKYLVNEVATLTGATIHKQGYGGCRMAKHTQSGNGLRYDKMCMYKIVDYIEANTSTMWQDFKDNAYNLVVANGDDNRPQAEALAVIDFSTIDAIIISFGTNDYGATDGALIGTNYDTDGNTFKGAVNKVINKLKTKYPKINLIFTTALYRARYQATGDGLNSDDYTNPQGLKLSDYNNALKEICEFNHIPYFDMNEISEINRYTASTLLADGLHPSENGCIFLSKKYQALLEGWLR